MSLRGGCHRRYQGRKEKSESVGTSARTRNESTPYCLDYAGGGRVGMVGVRLRSPGLGRGPRVGVLPAHWGFRGDYAATRGAARAVGTGEPVHVHGWEAPGTPTVPPGVGPFEQGVFRTGFGPPRVKEGPAPAVEGGTGRRVVGFPPYRVCGARLPDPSRISSTGRSGWGTPAL